MKRLLLPLLLTALAAPNLALANEALAKSNGCFTCHAVDKKKMGPAYQELAKKYKGDAGAEAKITAFLSKGGKKIKIGSKEQDHKVVKGGDADASTLAKWILSL